MTALRLSLLANAWAPQDYSRLRTATPGSRPIGLQLSSDPRAAGAERGQARDGRGHAGCLIADKYVMRCGDLPVEVAGDEMLQGIAAENDEKWATHVVPYYVIVDVDLGRATAHFYELSESRQW